MDMQCLLLFELVYPCKMGGETKGTFFYRSELPAIFVMPPERHEIITCHHVKLVSIYYYVSSCYLRYRLYDRSQTYRVDMDGRPYSTLYNMYTFDINNAHNKRPYTHQITYVIWCVYGRLSFLIYRTLFIYLWNKYVALCWPSDISTYKCWKLWPSTSKARYDCSIGVRSKMTSSR